MSSTPSILRPTLAYEPPNSAFADATGDASSASPENVEPLPPPALSEDQFARVAKALADPRRFSILEIIAAHGEIACQLLCTKLPVKQATVSHHVKELSQAGLVETRRDGQFVYYRYVPEAASQYMATLARRLQLPPTLRGQRGAA